MIHDDDDDTTKIILQVRQLPHWDGKQLNKKIRKANKKADKLIKLNKVVFKGRYAEREGFQEIRKLGNK